MDPDKARRREEAIAWFAALRSNAMLVEDRQAYDAWRADPQNQAAMDAVREFWGELAALKELRAAPASSRPRRLALAGAAAALLIAGALAASVMLQSSDRTIATSIGEQNVQSLPDGSLVAVNVASRISYAIKEDARLVTMNEGEAQFTVKPDKERPFLVRAGDYEIRAVGTAFNVRQRDGLVEIGVSEGKVMICALSGAKAGDTLVVLAAGNLIRLPATFSGALPRLEDIPPEDVAQWRSLVVSYENAPLSDVVTDLNRYFGRPLAMEGSDLPTMRVTIRLQVQDRERAIATLAGLLGVGTRKDVDRDVLKPN